MEKVGFGPFVLIDTKGGNLIFAAVAKYKFTEMRKQTFGSAWHFHRQRTATKSPNGLLRTVSFT